MEWIDNAGTSTKYDYLSSYASNSSSQEKTPYYRTTSYASVIDTDELTKNYFEKYYNKPSSTGYSLLEREINVRSVQILHGGWREMYKEGFLVGGIVHIVESNIVSQILVMFDSWNPFLH